MDSDTETNAFLAGMIVKRTEAVKLIVAHNVLFIDVARVCI